MKIRSENKDGIALLITLVAMMVILLTLYFQQAVMKNFEAVAVLALTFAVCEYYAIKIKTKVIR